MDHGGANLSRCPHFCAAWSALLDGDFAKVRRETQHSTGYYLWLSALASALEERLGDRYAEWLDTPSLLFSGLPPRASMVMDQPSTWVPLVRKLLPPHANLGEISEDLGHVS